MGRSPRKRRLTERALAASPPKPRNPKPKPPKPQQKTIAAASLKRSQFFAPIKKSKTRTTNAEPMDIDADETPTAGPSRQTADQIEEIEDEGEPEVDGEDEDEPVNESELVRPK